MIRILPEAKNRQKQGNLWILVASGPDDEKQDHKTSNVIDIQRRKLQEKQQNKAK